MKARIVRIPSVDSERMNRVAVRITSLTYEGEGEDSRATCTEVARVPVVERIDPLERDGDIMIVHLPRRDLEEALDRAREKLGLPTYKGMAEICDKVLELGEFAEARKPKEK